MPRRSPHADASQQRCRSPFCPHRHLFNLPGQPSSAAEQQSPISLHTLLAPQVLGCAGAHLTAKAVHHRDRLGRRCVMVMTIRVMSSGRGYEYLMKSVATGDTACESGTPLTRYYTETGW